MDTMTVGTITWNAASGKRHKYWIHPIGTQFKPIGGNYIFARETKPGHWAPIYIGETDNLNERFDNHHKMACIRRNGATHIHVHLNENYLARPAEERDLIAHWNPPCNG